MPFSAMGMARGSEGAGRLGGGVSRMTSVLHCPWRVSAFLTLEFRLGTAEGAGGKKTFRSAGATAGRTHHRASGSLLIFVIGGNTYAIVTGFDDNGVQLMSIGT